MTEREMINELRDKVIEIITDVYDKQAQICESADEIIDLVEAALSQQQEAEPVGYLSDANAGALREGRNTRIYAEPTPWVHRPVFLRPPKPAAQPVTMDDAIAAGDGTLHGAIDYWQQRALKAEAAQPQVPEGES